MPVLRQLDCSIELGVTNVKLEEYGLQYVDNKVRTTVAIPEVELEFSVHLTSSGYIAPGLAMFVFIDGEYQANRNRRGLLLPGPNVPSASYEIDMRIRQKESRQRDGSFIGRSWTFHDLKLVTTEQVKKPKQAFLDNLGTIEVVILRCKDTPRPAVASEAAQLISKPDPRPISDSQPADAVRCESAEKHSLTPTKAASLKGSELGGLSGLFDGPADDPWMWKGMRDRARQPDWDEHRNYTSGLRSSRPLPDTRASLRTYQHRISPPYQVEAIRELAPRYSRDHDAAHPITMMPDHLPRSSEPRMDRSYVDLDNPSIMPRQEHHGDHNLCTRSRYAHTTPTLPYRTMPYQSHSHEQPLAPDIAREPWTSPLERDLRTQSANPAGGLADMMSRRAARQQYPEDPRRSSHAAGDAYGRGDAHCGDETFAPRKDCKCHHVTHGALQNRPTCNSLGTNATCVHGRCNEHNIDRSQKPIHDSRRSCLPNEKSPPSRKLLTVFSKVDLRQSVSREVRKVVHTQSPTGREISGEGSREHKVPGAWIHEPSQAKDVDCWPDSHSQKTNKDPNTRSTRDEPSELFTIAKEQQPENVQDWATVRGHDAWAGAERGDGQESVRRGDAQDWQSAKLGGGWGEIKASSRQHAAQREAAQNWGSAKSEDKPKGANHTNGHRGAQKSGSLNNEGCSRFSWNRNHSRDDKNEFSGWDDFKGVRESANQTAAVWNSDNPPPSEPRSTKRSTIDRTQNSQQVANDWTTPPQEPLDESVWPGGDAWQQRSASVKSNSVIKARTPSRKASSVRSNKPAAQHNTGSSALENKSYWQNWTKTPTSLISATSSAKAERVPNPYVSRTEPLAPIPRDEAARLPVTQQVRAGKGAVYTHLCAKPEYMDTMEHPYAVFVFQYRSKDAVEKKFSVKIDNRESHAKAKVAGMTREELAEEVMRMKLGSRLGNSDPKDTPNARSVTAGSMAHVGGVDERAKGKVESHSKKFAEVGTSRKVQSTPGDWAGDAEAAVGW